MKPPRFDTFVIPQSQMNKPASQIKTTELFSSDLVDPAPIPPTNQIQIL